MYVLVHASSTVRRSNFELCRQIDDMMQRILGKVNPQIKVKGQIINNLIKASPKPLDIATQTLQTVT